MERGLLIVVCRVSAMLTLCTIVSFDGGRSCTSSVGICGITQCDYCGWDMEIWIECSAFKKGQIYENRCWRLTTLMSHTHTHNGRKLGNCRIHNAHDAMAGGDGGNG